MTDGLLPATTLATMATAAFAGLVRGATGFGGAMVMTPPLSVLLGPQVAVPLTLVLESIAASPMIPGAYRIANWRTLRPLALAAVCCVPLGTWVLAIAPAEVLRRAIAIVVALFSLVLLAGVRYRGTPSTPTSLAVGGLSGAMLGATGIGGPPIVLYLLASPDPASVTRANLTLFVALISSIGLASLAWRGVVGAPALWLAAAAALPFLGGLYLGTRAFARLHSARMRRLTILFMLAVAVLALVA